jgi:hypothetical protein
MATIKRKSKMTDDDFRRDFEDSVIMEELDFDTIPMELLAEFEAMSIQSKGIDQDVQEHIETEFDQLRDTYL